MFVTYIKPVQPLIDYLTPVGFNDNDNLNFNNDVNSTIKDINLEITFFK